MAIRITHVRYSGLQPTHESLAAFQWVNEASGKSDSSTKSVLVDWIGNKGGQAYVGQGSNRSTVGVVRPQNGDPYLRTYADGQWNNNLLSLPTF